MIIQVSFYSKIPPPSSNLGPCSHFVFGRLFLEGPLPSAWHVPVMHQKLSMGGPVPGTIKRHKTCTPAMNHMTVP